VSRGRRLLVAAAAVVALLVLAASPAAAQAAPRVAISELTATKVSVQATGFARQATVEFTVTIGSCTGRSSMVATADVLILGFGIAEQCTGAAVATAAAGGQSVSTPFVVDNPRGIATLPPAGSALPDTATGGGTATGAPAGATTSSTASVPAAPGRRAVNSACTVRVTGSQAPAVKPGDTVCFTGSLSGRLEIKQGGTPEAPIIYSGMGTATVPGITARGDNIVLEGFVSSGAQDNGFYVSGKNITIRDNDISRVSITDDDVDAIRFFGDDITIAHNTAHDIWANPQAGGDPHTDCMQTYAHSEPASSNIRIEGNHCASPQFRQCLMAEGPNDFEDGASGVGRSANWLVTKNYFECHAPAQSIALQDIHNVTFSANVFAGTGNKAIALQKDATGATVTPDNVKGPGYRRLVGIDDASANLNYNGPTG
jgi:hypothetical protein